jgi:hypothetical protein
MKPHRRGAFEIRSCHIARHVKVEPPERICLSCGGRIGRLSTIAYALLGGLCASCDTREEAPRDHDRPVASESSH